VTRNPRLTPAENALFDDENDFEHRGYSPQGDDTEPDVAPSGPGPVTSSAESQGE
jgi:hypothetical protein